MYMQIQWLDGCDCFQRGELRTHDLSWRNPSLDNVKMIYSHHLVPTGAAGAAFVNAKMVS